MTTYEKKESNDSNCLRTETQHEGTSYGHGTFPLKKLCVNVGNKTLRFKVVDVLNANNDNKQQSNTAHNQSSLQVAPGYSKLLDHLSYTRPTQN
ncbi:hypothetical protein DdX_05384 [Ditylenchus destructor]|uniref:Uncharacterized protein n=1 Tax=Ditylenchus destructor TaxID=166010 RepID=A0AAD4NC45_9BILA|nr:hypothetical protein DdX_05384 [Ditylenchus destructor]